MQSSNPNIATVTPYLNNLAANLLYVGRNRKALTAAAQAGDALAEDIIDRFYDFMTAEYTPSEIKAFNADVEAHQSREQAHA